MDLKYSSLKVCLKTTIYCKILNIILNTRRINHLNYEYKSLIILPHNKQVENVVETRRY